VRGTSKFLLKEMKEESTHVLRVFVLADTHDHLPEKVTELAKDADEIWHLGDVCADRVVYLFGCIADIAPNLLLLETIGGK